jgi:probable HAF family extracellular repeat protein
MKRLKAVRQQILLVTTLGVAVGLGACNSDVALGPMDVPLHSTSGSSFRSAHVATVTVTDLGSLGAGLTHATGINSKGQVVGASAGHAFLWEKGVMTDLGTLGGSQSGATGINSKGQVVGTSTTSDGAEHGFLWQDGVMSDIGEIKPTAINSAGQVAGFSGSHAFLWENGVMTDLGTLGGSFSRADGINSQGQVVGSSTTSGGPQHAFLWEKGVMTDLGTLGGSTSGATGINSRGQVVGSSNFRTNLDVLHAFLWQKGVMTDLGTLGGGFGETVAQAINAKGQVVGWSDANTAEHHAFLWEKGVMTDLDANAPVTRMAFAINSAGTIVGGASGDSFAILDFAVMWTVK